MGELRIDVGPLRARYLCSRQRNRGKQNDRVRERSSQNANGTRNNLEDIFVKKFNNTI